jgi:hypothetical protein
LNSPAMLGLSASSRAKRRLTVADMLPDQTGDCPLRHAPLGGQHRQGVVVPKAFDGLLGMFRRQHSRPTKMLAALPRCRAASMPRR